jgi:hypothetical protein
MTVIEAHLNRRGVNTIELSAREIPADAGSDILIHLNNHGSPTHATIRTQNGQAYTDFLHENLYVDAEEDYSIPIRESSGDGAFDLEFITGYGARTTKLRVVVSKACPIIQPEVTESPQEDEVIQRTPPHLPSLIPCIIACILYLVWLSFRGEILAPVDAFATVTIVLLLLAGVVTACRSSVSS